MTPPVTPPSPRDARISGLCYLAVVPRLIGALMIGAGIGYFANAIGGVVAPAQAEMLSWLLVPCFVGELSPGLWLAEKGVAATGPEVE